MIVPDTGALVGWVRPGSEPICDRQIGNRRGYASENVEHTGGGVPIDRQIGGAGAVDRHIVGDLEFAAGQKNRARDACGVNRVCRARQTMAKRARTAVGSAGYSAVDGWQNNVRSRWCHTGVDVISGNGIVAVVIR